LVSDKPGGLVLVDGKCSGGSEIDTLDWRARGIIDFNGPKVLSTRVGGVREVGTELELCRERWGAAECQQHEKHLLDGAGWRTPSKEQGRLEGRTKSRRFDKYLHGSLPWGIVPVTRVHLYFQRRKAPQARGFAFVINKEHGRGGLFADANDSGMRIADDACLTFSLTRGRKT
jgi:hypothetical protein